MADAGRFMLWRARRAYAQNHAAELLKKPEELGLRTGPRSRAAPETRTDVEGATTQCRPTELPTQARRSREARKPQSSRWTCHNIHITAKYKYYIGLHYIALHCMVFHCIASYWIAWDGSRKDGIQQSRHHHLRRVYNNTNNSPDQRPRACWIFSLALCSLLRFALSYLLQGMRFTSPFSPSSGGNWHKHPLPNLWQGVQPGPHKVL